MCIVSFCIGSNYRDLTAASPPAGGSALTDAPVVQPALSNANVFTTLLLKAMQHATDLMVKVAPLLPSRGLLSSQRQLRWAHTGGLPKYGLTNVIFNFLLFAHTFVFHQKQLNYRTLP